MVLIKGVTQLIGLGTEAYAHHKNKKTEEAQQALQGERRPQLSPTHSDSTNIPATTNPNTLAPPLPYTSRQRRGSAGSNVSDISAYEVDENEWVFDEAQDQLEGITSDGNGQTTDQLVDIFTQQHPPPQYSTDTGKLPCAVIIPQKRPESKTRGFVRAYAPVLNDSGIDQATFLDFLDNYTKSFRGEGYFNATNLAIAAGVFTYTVSAATINPAVHFAALAVHTSIEAGKRLHNTHQLNTYLEKMNAALFKPHGLYAMLMTYKPDTSAASVQIDPATNMIKAVYARNNTDRSKFRSASGITQGEAQLPESAPLVFPALEAADPEKKKNAFKRAGAFVGDYQDRKARAQFMKNNPESKLNAGLEEPKFASIFSDPNHAINQGGALNILTGGYLHKGAKKLQQGGYGSAVPFKVARQAGKEGTGVGGSNKSPIKRLIGENVLYLVIVNMPTDEELAEAAKWEGGDWDGSMQSVSQADDQWYQREYQQQRVIE